MSTYLYIAQIVVAVALIAVVLLQVRGGGLGGIFGQQSSVYRTRRGIEKTTFQIGIALAVVFIILCLVSVRLNANSRLRLIFDKFDIIPTTIAEKLE